jgi:hypothetical protein
MKANNNRLGTQDVERGMLSSSIGAFVKIAVLAVAVLLIFNAAGLEAWARQRPPSPVTEWLVSRASEWHTLMVRLGPADWYGAARTFLQQPREP